MANKIQINNVKNACYAQSGGMTAVINASASGVIETCQLAFKAGKIGKIFAAKNGVLGIITEELYDVSKLSKKQTDGLMRTPSGAFGSCRYKLKNIEEDDSEYRRIIDIFKEHNIGYFFYNGGNDSADTAYKLSQLSKKIGYNLVCIGIPKTIDNDLEITDSSPGYASSAKFLATATKEAGIDLISMQHSTKVYLLQTMGRHSGWLPAATASEKKSDGDAPHIILFPEIPFEKEKFLEKVKSYVKKYGNCFVVTAEALKTPDGKYIAVVRGKDSFGHDKLEGTALILSTMIHEELGFSCRSLCPDVLQRCSGHLIAPVDMKQAYELGKAAVKLALNGKNGVMPIIKRKSNKPFKYSISDAPLEKIAGQERQLPRNFISKDGFMASESFYEYILPLISGEYNPKFKNGVPYYEEIKFKLIEKKLKKFIITN